MWDLLKKLILILARFSGTWGWSNSGGTFERPVFNSKQICWLYLASARQRTYLIYVYNDMDSFELYYVKPWGSPPLPPPLRGTPCLRQKTKNLLQGCTSQPASNWGVCHGFFFCFSPWKDSSCRHSRRWPRVCPYLPPAPPATASRSLTGHMSTCREASCW